MPLIIDLLNVFLAYSVESYFYSFFSLVIVGFFYFLTSKRLSQNLFYFEHDLLLLIAYVIKSDNKVTALEKRMAYWFLKKEFGAKKANQLNKELNTLLKQPVSIAKTLQKLNENEAYETNLQLFYFLVRIAVVDKYLATKEYEALLKIALGLSLNKRQLDSFLAMHSFVKESTHQRKRQSNQRKKTRSYTVNKSRLQLAFAILELDETASEKEIKKSYRKLVVLYHPDKVMHLDKKMQVGAKEKFQKLQDAYDYIKQIKRIK